LDIDNSLLGIYFYGSIYQDKKIVEPENLPKNVKKIEEEITEILEYSTKIICTPNNLSQICSFRWQNINRI